MALQGTLTKYTSTPTDEVLDTFTITHPVDLTEGDWNYDKRGTTEEVIEYVYTESSTDHIVYIVLTNSNVFKFKKLDGEVVFMFEYNYRIYNSKEDYQSNYDSHINIGGHAFELFDWNGDTNPYSVAYNHIKSQKGFENLIND